MSLLFSCLTQKNKIARDLLDPEPYSRSTSHSASPTYYRRSVGQSVGQSVSQSTRDLNQIDEEDHVVDNRCPIRPSRYSLPADANYLVSFRNDSGLLVDAGESKDDTLSHDKSIEDEGDSGIVGSQDASDSQLRIEDSTSGTDRKKRRRRKHHNKKATSGTIDPHDTSDDRSGSGSNRFTSCTEDESCSDMEHVPCRVGSRSSMREVKVEVDVIVSSGESPRHSSSLSSSGNSTPRNVSESRDMSSGCDTPTGDAADYIESNYNRLNDPSNETGEDLGAASDHGVSEIDHNIGEKYHSETNDETKVDEANDLESVVDDNDLPKVETGKAAQSSNNDLPLLTPLVFSKEPLESLIKGDSTHSLSSTVSPLSPRSDRMSSSRSDRMSLTSPRSDQASSMPSMSPEMSPVSVCPPGWDTAGSSNRSIRRRSSGRRQRPASVEMKRSSSSWSRKSGDFKRYDTMDSGISMASYHSGRDVNPQQAEGQTKFPSADNNNNAYEDHRHGSSLESIGGGGTMLDEGTTVIHAFRPSAEDAEEDVFYMTVGDKAVPVTEVVLNADKGKNGRRRTGGGSSSDGRSKDSGSSRATSPTSSRSTMTPDGLAPVRGFTSEEERGECDCRSTKSNNREKQPMVSRIFYNSAGQNEDAIVADREKMNSDKRKSDGFMDLISLNKHAEQYGTEIPYNDNQYYGTPLQDDRMTGYYADLTDRKPMPAAYIPSAPIPTEDHGISRTPMSNRNSCADVDDIDIELDENLNRWGYEDGTGTTGKQPRKVLRVTVGETDIDEVLASTNAEPSSWPNSRAMITALDKESRHLSEDLLARGKCLNLDENYGDLPNDTEMVMRMRTTFDIQRHLIDNLNQEINTQKQEIDNLYGQSSELLTINDQLQDDLEKTATRLGHKFEDDQTHSHGEEPIEDEKRRLEYEALLEERDSYKKKMEQMARDYEVLRAREEDNEKRKNRPYEVRKMMQKMLGK